MPKSNNKTQDRRDLVKLVVSNEKPKRNLREPEKPKADDAHGDSRVVDLLAIVFVICVALALVYLFRSLDHADKALFCLTAGGHAC